MPFFDAFLNEALARHSLWLLALVVACAALKGLLPQPEKKRLRFLAAVTALHLLLVGISAAKAADPAADLGTLKLLRLAGFIFEAGGYIGVFNLIVFSMVLARTKMGLPMVLRDVSGILIMVIVVVAASPSFGFDWRGVAATSAGLVAVVGLALQETMSNVIGRVALQLDKSITIGDWISVDGHMGQVTDMRWRYAVIETNNYETVVIPNGQLLKSKFVVHGRRGGYSSPWRRWIYFHVDFKVPSVEVQKVVNQALTEERIPNVATAPKSDCVLMDLELSTARYAARYWLENPAVDDATDSLVRTRISYALRRAGIELAMPVQSVLLTQQDEAHAQATAESDLRERSSALGRVELFRSLKDQERHSLARSLRRAPFTEGEIMTRQGAEAHWLYIIERGKVGIRVAVEDGEREVATLSNGDYFGEMGLMTGEPRNATVVALTNVDSFRLDKEIFRELLASRPEIAEQMADSLARRKTELDAVRENLDKEAQARRQAESRSHLLGRIKRFFSME
jgi:small-conductance mechanosensitive channel/CRP-like cAMP-binding protein